MSLPTERRYRRSERPKELLDFSAQRRDHVLLTLNGVNVEKVAPFNALGMIHTHHRLCGVCVSVPVPALLLTKGLYRGLHRRSSAIRKEVQLPERQD